MRSEDFKFKDDDGYLVVRDWEDRMIELLDKAHVSVCGYVEDNIPEKFIKYVDGRAFENEIFRINPFDYDVDSDNALPNFIYKPTGYAIKWYKHALRASYANKNITFKEFDRIIIDCLKSLDI